MLRDDREFDRRESIYDLQDILRGIDRLLEDSNIITDGEASEIYVARDSLVSVMESLQSRA